MFPPKAIYVGIGDFGRFGVGNLGDFTENIATTSDRVAQHDNETWRVYRIDTARLTVMDVSDVVREMLPAGCAAMGGEE